MVDGVQLLNDHVLDSQEKCWRSNVSAFLATQPRHSCPFQTLDVANIVHHQKEAADSALNGNDQLSSLALYKSSQHMVAVHIPYISVRNINFCHMLHSQKLAREDI